MKVLFTLTTLFFFFYSYSQEDPRTVISKGDTLEMTKELRKEYTFMETVAGEVLKVDDIKYLIIWDVSKKSKHFVLAKEPQETKPYFEQEIGVNDSSSVSSKSILAVEQYKYLDVAGLHLEKAGQYKNAAIVTTILTAGAGVATILLTDSKETQIAGYAVIGLGQLTSLILNVAGNSNIKKAGEIFRKEKLKL